MNTANVIEIQDLSFSYSKKSKKIFDNLSMKVPRGAIYGFLGANGAGKSTTMQLLTGSLRIHEQNQIKLFGNPLYEQLPQIFKKVGSLIESPSLYTHLSGYDNLKCIAMMKGVQLNSIDNILELVGLLSNSKQKVKEYSMGMKQRLGIGMALLGKPELLLLDEPINGLDPQGVIDMRTLLVNLNTEYGTTIFVSSHLLDEVEKICTHVGVINNGKLAFDGTINALKEETKKSHKTILTINNVEKWYELLKQKNQHDGISYNENTIYVEPGQQENTRKILITLLTNGANILEMKSNKGLEDLFLDLTKHSNSPN